MNDNIFEIKAWCIQCKLCQFRELFESSKKANDYLYDHYKDNHKVDDHSLGLIWPNANATLAPLMELKPK